MTTFRPLGAPQLIYVADSSAASQQITAQTPFTAVLIQTQIAGLSTPPTTYININSTSATISTSTVSLAFPVGSESFVYLYTPTNSQSTSTAWVNWISPGGGGHELLFTPGQLI